MPLWSDHGRCPKCEQPALERETWMSTKDFREECCECGYFSEVTHGYSVTNELGIMSDKGVRVLDQHKLLEALGQMHFKTESYPCMREGFIRKDEANKGKYVVVGSWFSSPSALEGIEVDWIESPGKQYGAVLNKDQQGQIKDFIRDYYSGQEIKAIYIFHEQAPSEEISTICLNVVLLTPTPTAIPQDGDHAIARLEEALVAQLGYSVTVDVRESRVADGVRLDVSVFSKQHDAGNYEPDRGLD